MFSKEALPSAEGIQTAATPPAPRIIPEPDTRAKVDQKANEVLEQLAERSDAALEVIDEVLAGGAKQSVRVSTAFNVLDRIGAHRTEQAKVEAAKEAAAAPKIELHLSEDAAKRLLTAAASEIVQERDVTPALESEQ